MLESRSALALGRTQYDVQAARLQTKERELETERQERKALERSLRQLVTERQEKKALEKNLRQTCLQLQREAVKFGEERDKWVAERTEALRGMEAKLRSAESELVNVRKEKEKLVDSFTRKRKECDRQLKMRDGRIDLLQQRIKLQEINPQELKGLQESLRWQAQATQPGVVPQHPWHQWLQQGQIANLLYKGNEQAFQKQENQLAPHAHQLGEVHVVYPPAHHAGQLQLRVGLGQQNIPSQPGFQQPGQQAQQGFQQPPQQRLQQQDMAQVQMHYQPQLPQQQMAVHGGKRVVQQFQQHGQHAAGLGGPLGKAAQQDNLWPVFDIKRQQQHQQVQPQQQLPAPPQVPWQQPGIQQEAMFGMYGDSLLVTWPQQQMHQHGGAVEFCDLEEVECQSCRILFGVRQLRPCPSHTQERDVADNIFRLLDSMDVDGGETHGGGLF